MTLILELTQDEEILLRERAMQQGQDVLSYTLGLVRQDLQESTELRHGRTLAEALAGRIGMFEYEGPGYRNREGGAAFAEHLAEKRRSASL